jgi:mono/diheme cytochrome c family protein
MILIRRLAAGVILAVAILSVAIVAATLALSTLASAPAEAAPKQIDKPTIAQTAAPKPAAEADDDGPDPEDLKLGEQLLTRDCAACHAVGRSGASPQKAAPAFRTLGQRYPVESLEEALGEGIMSGHPDMPEFSFDADQVGAIIDYLKSIQVR